jgi:hypothetical protein
VPWFEGEVGWRAPFSTALIAAAVGVMAFLVTPRLYRLGVLHMASMGLAVVLGNWIVTLLMRDSGMSAGAAGVVGALILLMGVVGRPLGGWIARHHPARTRQAIQLSFLVGALGTAVLATGPSPSLAVVAAAVVRWWGSRPGFRSDRSYTVRRCTGPTLPEPRSDS